jgi:hypothetical protein
MKFVNIVGEGKNMNIDDLHIPEDVDENIKEDFIEILKTIPDRWGRWVSLDKGWYKLVIDTHKKLKYIDPNYEIHQVKEKFGGLRYYYQSSFPHGSIQDEIMESIINTAEKDASHTCEICGVYGGAYGYKHDVQLRDRNRWYKTLCKPCAIKNGYSIRESDE